MNLTHHETVVRNSEWEQALMAQGLDTVAGVYGCTEGEVITRSGSTEVRRIVLRAPGAPVVYLKKYWVNRRKQIWSGFFRGAVLGKTKARREYENLGRLRKWGLGAPAPVAWGEERRTGAVRRSFLISEGVPASRQLDQVIRQWLPAQLVVHQIKWRAELVACLAAHTRQMHAHRFCHHDYFWRNILLSDNSLRQFWLIDSHKGTVWRPWNEKRSRVKDLATLDAVAPRFFRRTERLRFFLAYLGQRRLGPGDKALARSVLRAAEPLRAPQLRRLGIDTGDDGRGAKPKDGLQIAEPFRRAFAELGLLSVPDVARHFLGKMPKTGVSVVPGEVPIPGGRPVVVFYKQYDYVPPSWKFVGRRSKAACEAANYAAFDRLGVPGAEVIAWGEQRAAAGRLRRAFILTRAIPEAVTLTEFFGSASREGRAWAAVRLAQLTRRIHEAHFFHHDLVWRNVLINTPGGKPAMWWIDCPRGGFDRLRLWRERKRIKDLASLDKSGVLQATLRERVLFLRTYLGIGKLDADARDLARRVTQYRRTRWPEDWTGV